MFIQKLSTVTHFILGSLPLLGKLYVMKMIFLLVKAIVESYSPSLLLTDNLDFSVSKGTVRAESSKTFVKYAPLVIKR